MMNKKDLELLGFTVIENDNDYVPTMKAIYDDVYGMWASAKWTIKVENRNIQMFNCKFLHNVFGNYEVLGYTVIITKSMKVAFLNREHQFMDENEIATLALVGLQEEMEFQTGREKNFIMITNI